MTAAVAQPWPPKVYEVGTLEELKEVISHRMADSKCIADIKLTADIYLGDGDGGTLCSTFCGTLDGNGHTIYGSKDGTRQNRNYLFTYSEGATFKNLTFKHIRKNSQDHSNQCIITSQARNNCVFENITFENCGAWSNYNNVGAAAGYAYNSTFTNIKVINSDFTVDDNYVGSVVGDADKCTFTNIEITNCDTYAHDDYAGGVIGHARNCKFVDVTIHSGFFKADGICAGGVAGKSVDGSTFTNCVTEDQVCVYADGTTLFEGTARVGGIVGYAEGGSFLNCINSAILFANDTYLGGIVGIIESKGESRSTISGCLNTGMLICPASEKEVSDYSTKYKTTNQMSCTTKYYNGKEYCIRTTKCDKGGTVYKVGGIAGAIENVDISQCANLGSIYSRNPGGIIGYIYEKNSVTDCLASFHYNTDYITTGGISNIDTSRSPIYSSLKAKRRAGASESPSSNLVMTNCLVAMYVNNQGDKYYDVKNNYALQGNNLTGYDLGTWGTVTNEAELASGLICSKLGEAWEQNVGIDPYPTPTGNGGLIFADNLDSEKYTYAGSTSNVTIKRTFDTDGWYSLCLPFSLTAEQTAEKFAQVAEFCEIDGDTYKFNTVDVMEAGKAYIVKVDAKLENPKFTNVTIAANVKADESGAFVGVLKPTVIGDDCKVIGSGTTVNPANAGTMKAFRAYFPASSSANARYFSVDDSEITSVESIKEGTCDDAIYNMQGIRVAEAKRGLYIVNGKKVFVK